MEFFPSVPTPPLNVTWVPSSPKDAILSWSPPRLVNGRLRSYLVAFSHDEQEWRNQTIEPYCTTTQVSAHLCIKTFPTSVVPCADKCPLWFYAGHFSMNEVPYNQTTLTTESFFFMSFFQIQDLVSNTNYTLHIAGVTRKGVGASTTVFIYIRATLEGEPQITTECKSIHSCTLEMLNY